MQRFLSGLFGFWNSDRTKIVPPMQNSPGLHIYPEPMPFFRFATASITVLNGESLIDVTISYPGKNHSAGAKHRIGEQNYFVQVPEFINESVVDVKLEERARKCQIEMLNSEESRENDSNTRFEFYSISVPYTRYENDGVKINQDRLEVRRNHAALDDRVKEFSPNTVVSRYRTDQLNCYSTVGSPLTPKQVLGRLKKERPVLLINDARFITTYFSRLLKSKSIFIVPNGAGQAIDQDLN